MAFHPVDRHVGLRMRQRRTLLGMSQSALATAVGITFQQVQKYERGANRVSASRLVEFAEVLDVKPEHFFDELPPEALASKGDAERKRARSGRARTEPDLDPMAKRETLELVRAYYKIDEARLRTRILEMVKTLSTLLPRSMDVGKARTKGRRP
jgi:transcriptional regulator with XRE-family HTH domain